MVVVVASTVGGTELSPGTGSVEVEEVVVDVRGCVVDVDELATVVDDDGAKVVLLDDVVEGEDVLVTCAEIVIVVAVCVVGGPVFIAMSVMLFAESCAMTVPSDVHETAT